MIELHFFDGKIPFTVTLAAVKRIAERNPGEHAVVIRYGQRRLELGPAWRADSSPATVHAFKLAAPSANVSVL